MGHPSPALNFFSGRGKSRKTKRFGSFARAKRNGQCTTLRLCIACCWCGPHSFAETSRYCPRENPLKMRLPPQFPHFSPPRPRYRCASLKKAHVCPSTGRRAWCLTGTTRPSDLKPRAPQEMHKLCIKAWAALCAKPSF